MKSKSFKFLFGVGISCLLIGTDPAGTSARKIQPEGKSGKQEITWDVVGDCVDEFDEDQDEFVLYEGEQCVFSVTAVPSKPMRTVALQWQNSNGRWVTESKARTNKNGIAFLYPETLDSDGDWFCDTFDYRIGLERLGNAKSLVSNIFTLTFVADADWC